MINGKLMFTVGIIVIPILLIVGGYYGYMFIVNDYDVSCIKEKAGHDCSGIDGYKNIKFRDGEWLYKCERGENYYPLEEYDKVMCLKDSRK